MTAWLGAQQPDVLLMQELKGEVFPAEAFTEMGYESVAVTQKTYNGVAVLSRAPIETITTTLAGDDKDSHARFIETRIDGLRIVDVYMPNGNPVGSDKFIYKLGWMDRFLEQMIRWQKDDSPTVIGGDFNVIPEDIDCHKPESWRKDALFQPEPRARYRAMLERGYVDAFRVVNALPDQYTWWSNRGQAWKKNVGWRIDYQIVSPVLKPRIQAASIWTKTRFSDHAPLIIDYQHEF